MKLKFVFQAEGHNLDTHRGSNGGCMRGMGDLKIAGPIGEKTQDIISVYLSAAHIWTHTHTEPPW